MNLREEVKDIIDNKPTKEDRKKAAAEARAKHMREKERALSSVSLSIRKGSFTAVLGANGSGKSTLAKQSLSLGKN